MDYYKNHCPDEYVANQNPYYNPYNDDGTQKSHSELKSGMKKHGEQARFYHKSGPGFNENGAPRTNMFSDIVIAQGFNADQRGYGTIQGILQEIWLISC